MLIAEGRPAASATTPPTAANPNSKTDPRRFALLVLPLLLLLRLVESYGIEQPVFVSLTRLALAGFVIHYWLPFRFKETFSIVLSLAAAFVVLSATTAVLLIVFGFLLFALVRSPLPFRGKLAILFLVLAAYIYGRAAERTPLPIEFWAVCGSMFFFRTIVYLYDLRHASEPPRLKEFLSYFFLLPNYYFLLFPIVDFQTMRKSFYRRDIHLVAQQGIWWIFRGVTHLMIYRLIYQSQGVFTPPRVSAPAAVMIKSAFSYLLILRVTGQYHIVAGMLHLFGYDLPETARRFLLANSFSDFWRRISIYWKDFMVKVVYFPVYFKLRRGGDLRAKLVATTLVFLVTWLLHAFQFFFLQGRLHVTANDFLYWAALGALVMTNVWMEHKFPKGRPKSGWVPQIRNVLQIAATFCTLSLLWSLWSANSMEEWFYFLKTGKV